MAEQALESGDYQQCLNLLEVLAKEYPLTEKKGAQIRMLMVTALMGKGQEQEAISTCRLLTHCKDNNLRQKARQLLEVLEAPSLPRPDNWSITLPKIDFTDSKGGARQNLKKRIPKETPPPPPTGPTKFLSIGFSLLVLIVLIVLSFALSGFSLFSIS